MSLTTGRTDMLVRGLIKRWPRLAGPVLVAVLGSWLLFALGGYFYAPAAALSGSSWFARFGGALTDAHFQPSFLGAVLQGAALTFLRGDSTYDFSLWTMAFEFYGSLMVYALAFLLAPRPALAHARVGRRRRGARLRRAPIRRSFPSSSALASQRSCR